MSTTTFHVDPIDKHLFLSDQRIMALVDTQGTINWLCTPRLDSAPLFGSIIGGPDSGYFRISGKGVGRQDYLGDTLIGRTTFDGISVTDFLDCSKGRVFQRAGRSDLLRLIEGSGDVAIEFAPKFNFGRVPTQLTKIDNGLRIECGEQRLVLYSPGFDWEITREGKHDVARYSMTLNNECVPLVLLIGTASAEFPHWKIERTINQTRNFWEGWLATTVIPDNHSALIRRSALLLRGLIYGPTGAIAAAGTCSLPEGLGGERNWDYRYCWPRDASYTAKALLSLQAPGPALRLLDWILEVVFDSDTDKFLAPLYTVNGRSVPVEAEIPEATGYKGSRPVRIGNLAAEQLQLDALGPIAELMAALANFGGALTEEHQKLADRFVTLISSRWELADSGIWEVRGEPRHFVHSKLMCWYTVKCCLKVSRYLGNDREDWEVLADRIRVQVEERGFDEDLQSYVAAYDFPHADAALLWVVLAEFHPPEHPRSVGTLNYLMKRLIHNGGVYRYHFDDALHGKEGEFIICRTWFIEALVKAGRRAEAQELFDEMVSRIAPLGILAEEWDTQHQCALGNYPQAYSHLGLINAARALSLE